MTNDKIRVVIVEDSGFTQLLIKSIISKDKEIQVVGTAYNGKEAIDQTLLHKPDVVVMDMLMPEYDGAFAIKGIMKKRPTPIVILSATGSRNSSYVMDMLKLGAVDFLNKPEGRRSNLRFIDGQIINKIKIASRVDPSKLGRAHVEGNMLPHVFTEGQPYDVIVIGSSTGGPTAIEKILKKMPTNLPVPILIAQHMPADFVESFAARLDQIIELPVRVAHKQTPLIGGHVYITPGDCNTIVRRNKATNGVVFDTIDTCFQEYNNPSINALMSSVAITFQGRAIAAILTGMGRDGIKGMDAISKKGGYTVAQDKDSSVVFGMPKEAIEAGIVNRIVPIDEMGEFLVSCL